MIDEESELDRLYAAPLDQFVKLRNDLAGRLRKEGNQAAATTIAALKKPSVSAWAVNQLARLGQLQRLIEAGEALEQEQSRAISGEASSGFEAARREEAAAIAQLRDAAQQLMPSPSTTTLERMVNTLRAGAATAAGRTLLKQGRLSEDMDPPGFDAFSGVGASAATETVTVPSAGGGKLADKIETLRRRQREADENATAREAEASELERQSRAAEEVARRALRAAENARKRADSAAARAKEVATELAELEKRI